MRANRAAVATLLLGAFLSVRPAWPDPAPEQVRKSLAGAAARQVGVTTLYDPSYVRLAYPNGDVPADRGVCTDVVVRAFRAVGVDLQVEVHEDMKKNFSVYPRAWGIKRPDRNIDHRRVPNLMKFFERKGKSIPLDGVYEPGDVVAWRLSNGLLHVGVIAEDRVAGTKRRYVIHNIGFGAQKEDVLFEFEILGHYRW